MVENAQWCNWKYSTVIAPPQILETTVLISPTVHSRMFLGGVLSMTTTAARVAPPAAAPAAPPMALYAAAAPATPELVGSGIDFSKRKATVSELRVAGYELVGLGRYDRDWECLR
jgi:hypothetical protein